MNEIDEIRQQMAQIRHDLHQDVSSVVSGVSDVVNEVSEAMDWRSVLRRHPYILMGAAMAAGYLMVPRRNEDRPPSQNQLARLVPADDGPRKKRFRPVSWAFDLLGPIATQAIQAYALMWIENRLKEHLHAGPESGLSGQHHGDGYQLTVPGHRQ